MGRVLCVVGRVLSVDGVVWVATARTLWVVGGVSCSKSTGSCSMGGGLCCMGSGSCSMGGGSCSMGGG